MKNNQILISGAIVFKDARGKRQWLIVRGGKEDKWEIPKITVRKGESSVRASLRLTGEMAGMNARILEEAGRGTGVATINGRSVPQKLYYYLLMQKAGSEIIGFEEFQWLVYEKAHKILFLKREKDMLKSAKEVLKKWEREKGNRN